MTLEALKIQDTETGLFSTGGMYPGWTKQGKTWSSLRALRCHLAQFVKTRYSVPKVYVNQVPKSWQIIHLKAEGTTIYNAHEDMNENNTKLKKQGAV